MELDLVDRHEIPGFSENPAGPWEFCINNCHDQLKKYCQLVPLGTPAESNSGFAQKLQAVVDSTCSVIRVKIWPISQYDSKSGYDQLRLTSRALVGWGKEREPILFKLRREFPGVLVNLVFWGRDASSDFKYESRSMPICEIGYVAAILVRESLTPYGMYYIRNCQRKGVLSITLTFPSTNVNTTLENNQAPPISNSSPKNISMEESAALNKQILEEELASDIVLVAENGKEFKCHKSFLFARSPVFRSMFKSGMQESKTDRIEAPDLTEKGVEALLKYLYYMDTSGPLEDSETAFELLYASRKYNVPKLEAEMTKVLSNLKNADFPVPLALKVFVFLRTIPNAEPLKTKVSEIMKIKFSELKELESYRELLKNDVEATMELMECFSLGPR